MVFLQTDPIDGGNANAYTYPNDPINQSDLTGLCWWGVHCWAHKVAKHWRGIVKVALYAGGIVGGSLCAASVACGIAVGAAVGAASYLAGAAGTRHFSKWGLFASTLEGAGFGGVGAGAARLREFAQAQIKIASGLSWWHPLAKMGYAALGGYAYGMARTVEAGDDAGAAYCTARECG